VLCQVFFHFTETSTRFPRGAPLVATADAPALQVATGVLFVEFLIGASPQGEAVARRGPASST
jgi:hypothetical protein